MLISPNWSHLGPIRRILTQRERLSWRQDSKLKNRVNCLVKCLFVLPRHNTLLDFCNTNVYQKSREKSSRLVMALRVTFHKRMLSTTVAFSGR